MSTLYHAKSLLRFYLKAKTIYKVHSPFVFALFRDALQLDKHYSSQAAIEVHRKIFLNSKDTIPFLELGAGNTDNALRAVSHIAKSSLSPDWQCRLLFNLVDYFQADTILELGTSLGISTAYLAAARKKSSVFTFEGNPSSAELAKDMFSSLGLDNIELIEGNFDSTLAQFLNTSTKKIDLIFLDGNHQYEASMRYFEQILPHCHEDTIIIYDDIYWSPDMNRAWETLKTREEISLSIDLYAMGLLFFKKSFKEKQHFKLIPSNLKPWQKYLP